MKIKTQSPPKYLNKSGKLRRQSAKSVLIGLI